MVNNQPTGFKELLNAMMKRRWFISAIVLGGFMIIIGGIFASIMIQTPMSTEWKELLLLLLGAFIGSYGKIIDYWFSDTDKDKMLVQKMDEEDGLSLSNTADIPNNPITPTNIQPLVLATNEGTEIDEDGDGIYTAEIQAPAVDGEYEIITIMNYESEIIGTKELRLITVVDPEGYIYQKIAAILLIPMIGMAIYQTCEIKASGSND